LKVFLGRAGGNVSHGSFPDLKPELVPPGDIWPSYGDRRPVATA
jgi:hypothetical protein